MDALGGPAVVETMLLAEGGDGDSTQVSLRGRSTSSRGKAAVETSSLMEKGGEGKGGGLRPTGWLSGTQLKAFERRVQARCVRVFRLFSIWGVHVQSCAGVGAHSVVCRVINRYIPFVIWTALGFFLWGYRHRENTKNYDGLLGIHGDIWGLRDAVDISVISAPHLYPSVSLATPTYL